VSDGRPGGRTGFSTKNENCRSASDTYRFRLRQWLWTWSATKLTQTHAYCTISVRVVVCDTLPEAARTVTE
jgi:hypothetical protein